MELIKRVVAAMCEHGFMNGWFGDTSDEFQQDEVNYFNGLSNQLRVAWVERNRYNLESYCGFSKDEVDQLITGDEPKALRLAPQSEGNGFDY